MLCIAIWHVSVFRPFFNPKWQFDFNYVSTFVIGVKIKKNDVSTGLLAKAIKQTGIINMYREPLSVDSQQLKKILFVLFDV